MSTCDFAASHLPAAHVQQLHDWHDTHAQDWLLQCAGKLRHYLRNDIYGSASNNYLCRRCFFCKTELRSGFHAFWSILACSQVHWPLLCFETFFDGKTCFCLQGRINQCSNMFGRTGAPHFRGPPHMRRNFFFLSQNCLLVKETAQNKLVESMYIRSFSLESRMGFVGALPQSPIFHRVS